MSSFAFNSNAGMDEDQALATWEALKVAIKEIQNGNASQLRFEELYRHAYTLVLHKFGDYLYQGVNDCIVDKLRETAKIVSGASTENLLQTIVSEWDRHKLIMTMIRDILMYMDKTYCTLHKKTRVYDLGLIRFKEHVVVHPSVNQRLRPILLENVAKERNNEVIDRTLMKNCLSMLVEVGVASASASPTSTSVSSSLGGKGKAPESASAPSSFGGSPREVYQTQFERDFLIQTRTYYRQESQQFIAHNTCPDYLRKVEQRLVQEEDRANTYLDKSTRGKLREVLNTELIAKYAQQLVENDQSGCVSLLQNNQVEDLGRMYQLFLRVPANLAHMRECMGQLVREIGTAIVQDTENLKNPKRFVQQVLDCRAKFTTIVDDAFQGDRDFSRALKLALEHFINLDARAAQYLSLYIDDMLRKGLKGISEQEVDTRLNHVISIFRYLHEKDVFENFYKQHLAGRLLSSTSGDADLEKMMISKLKAECGHQFTSRLEGMFKDMEVSKQTMDAFQQFAARQGGGSSSTSGGGNPAQQLVVSVLTTGFWPVPQAPECRLPVAAEACTKLFDKYYQSVYSERRLTWQTNLGTAELRCRFAKGGRRELVVATYQMCVLMLFNSGNTFTFQQLLDLTGVPEEELTRHVLSLAHPKVRVLKKSPNTKSVEANHKFGWNEKYKNKLFRVKVPLLSKGSVGSAKSSEVPPHVLEARKNRVEASIVRVMKSRKVLEHNLLIAEVVKQLTSRFPAEPGFIKKRIESLIEREYLERDAKNRRLYHYLA